MRVDTLQRLIEASDWTSFRELAMLYLDASGYSRVDLKDGQGDGGNDVAVWRLGGNPEPLAIQLSVQRRSWQSKLRQDAIQAADTFGHRRFIYVTSRRIPGGEVQPIVDELWASHNITASVVDSQSLASRFYVDERTQDVLRVLGVTDMPNAHGDRGGPGTVREDLAYAYAFFGTDVESFRRVALERSIAAYLTRPRSRDARDRTINAVARAVGLTQGRQAMVSAAVDRMLQHGSLVAEGERLVVAPGVQEAYKSARIVRGRHWRQLQDQIDGELGAAGLRGAALESVSESVGDAAGALMMYAGSSAGTAVELGADTRPARARMRSGLRQVERDLTQVNVDPADAANLMTRLAVVISKSEVGQTLLAGELFLSLLSMERTDLLRALGGHSELEVFLDASVAIPLLASLLYEPHEAHFFRGAHYMFEQAQRYDVRLRLPRDYLEEAASHLLEANEKYQPILDVDPDLRFSRNAFVAHYLALRQEGKLRDSFPEYMSSFGLRLGGVQRSFRAERDWIMDRMRTHFSGYGIDVVEAGVVPQDALRQAQDAIAYTARELGLHRKGRLLDHDARAVADISARAAVGSREVIFCTWDRLHLRLRTAAGSVDWHALDPAMVGDLLALASPQDDAPTGTAIDVALDLASDDSQRGAEIWDELVRLEQTRLYDAEAIRRARAFKDAYFASMQDQATPEPLSRAWENWKAETQA